MTLRTLISTVAVLLAIGTLAHAQTNYLEPPGEPGSEAAKMKTLNQVEPRTLIDSLPFAITNAGSYYLARPLRGVAFSNGITILSHHVKLDLAGFPMIGLTNALHGIVVPGNADNISIRNGVIADWGQCGIMATNARDVVLSEVKAFNNRWGGLYVGENALIERCAAYGNGFQAPGVDPPLSDGIQAGSFSTIHDCKARYNKGANIHGYSFTRVTQCTATESAEANGIWVDNYCTVRDCTVARNFNDGIRVASRCRVTENTCGENGIHDPATNVAGIAVQGSNSLIERNNLVANDIGIFIPVGSLGNLVIINAASKNIIDYRIMEPNNFIGPVWVMGGQFTNMNPWVNFQGSFFGPP